MLLIEPRTAPSTRIAAAPKHIAAPLKQQYTIDMTVINLLPPLEDIIYGIISNKIVEVEAMEDNKERLDSIVSLLCDVSQLGETYIGLYIDLSHRLASLLEESSYVPTQADTA